MGREMHRKINKNWVLTKTSLAYQTQEYLYKSTLHGVRYLAEPDRPIIESVIWFCCIATGATTALIIILSLWDRFQTNPTITGLDTDFHNFDVEFPAVSLCFTQPIDEKRLEEYIESEHQAFPDKARLKKFLIALASIRSDNLLIFNQFAADLDIPQDNLVNLARKVVYHCDALIKDCSYKGENISCCDHFYPYFTESGFCYGFNVDPSQGLFSFSNKTITFNQRYIYESDSSWSLEFTLPRATNESVLIYLHTANEKPGLDNYPRREFVGNISKIAYSTKTTYTTDDTYQLSIRQRRCVFPDEIKLSNSALYSYPGCMRQCRIKLAIKHCKCVPFFYSKTYANIYCTLSQLNCLSEHANEIFSRIPCECDLCCENTEYEVEKMTEFSEDAAVPNRLEIAPVSWPAIRYKREVLFGWVDLLVSFGGIAGLFLGFSLLSLVEIIYYFTMRALCMVIIDKMKLETLRNEEQLREKPALDLGLTPIWMRKKKHSSSDSSKLLVEVQERY